MASRIETKFSYYLEYKHCFLTNFQNRSIRLTHRGVPHPRKRGFFRVVALPRCVALTLFFKLLLNVRISLGRNHSDLTALHPYRLEEHSVLGGAPLNAR